MAYMRGKYYLHTSGSSASTPDTRRLHIWSADGEDTWDNSGWACDEDGIRFPEMEHAGGTHLPLHVMAEFVIMRLIEMIQEGVVDAAIHRLLASGRPLFAKNAETLRSALSSIRLEGPAKTRLRS